MQVVVADRSPLCRTGWIGLLAIDETITAVVPDEGLVDPVQVALRGLAPSEAVDRDVVAARLPPTRGSLGPAHLAYWPIDRDPGVVAPVTRVRASDLGPLFADATPDELDECGLATLPDDAPAFASRSSNGTIAAACGYRTWPNGVAHLGVLSAAQHRRRGHAEAAARAAIADAVGRDLLPQWRARVTPSIELARRLGFVHHGAQLSFEPASPSQSTSRRNPSA
jgi:hypothetical protein